MTNEMISEKLLYPSRYIDVYGSKMHFIEVGEGNPILFLHGIPTSSYLWRNIIPHLSSLGRCIAPDLIGFGKSDKPDIAYSIHEHIKYIEKFIETLQLKNITLVMHGWGSVIGLDYAMRHEKNCLGLVLYEAFLHSFKQADLSLPYQEQLIILQNQETVNRLSIDGTSYFDTLFPQTILRDLTDEERRQYRQPFLIEGAGKPILTYLKELPTGDGDSKVDELINAYSKKLESSKLPKLLLYSMPGFITNMSTLMWAKEYLSNLEMIDVGEELHYAQESYPQLIGESISVWLQSVEQL